MKNGRRSKLSASAASYNKPTRTLQPQSQPQAAPNENQNENLKRKRPTKTKTKTKTLQRPLNGRPTQRQSRSGSHTAPGPLQSAAQASPSGSSCASRPS